MKVLLDIKDSKAAFFMEMLQNFSFVKATKLTDSKVESLQGFNEDAIPQWQQEEVNRRLQLIEKGEMKTRSWNEAKAGIFKK